MRKSSPRSLEDLLRAPRACVSGIQACEINPTHLLLTAVGGGERLARLKTLYDKARPWRSRGGPGILTVDEVFREAARKDGYSDEGVAMFIDELV